MRAPQSLSLLIALSTLAVCRADEPAFPQTHAGRCAADYFAAFNSNDEARMRSFEEQWRAKSALATRSTDERIKQARELRGRWGALAPTSINSNGERDLRVLAEQSASGELFEYSFEFEEQPPHGLIGIRIMGPVRDEDAGALAKPLDKESRAGIVNEIADALVEAYVYPDTGRKLADALREKLAGGAYDAFSNAGDLARRLTEDMRGICHDRHLAVRPGKPRGLEGIFEPDRDRRDNYGFQKVELLPGNIGYIKFDMFNPTEPAKAVAAAALAFVQNCDALIFDLRENGGGSPEMIKFISSYLFDKPTHLNSFIDRLSNKTSETWTDAEIPGKRFRADLPVYVLTSHYTFSGAEEFTYNLLNLKRATIVGETTGGGAHPVAPRAIADCLTLMTPYARAENPITKTNWEGVGVKPHIETSAEKALDTALEDARRRLASTAGARPSQ